MFNWKTVTLLILVALLTIYIVTDGIIIFDVNEVLTRVFSTYPQDSGELNICHIILNGEPQSIKTDNTQYVYLLAEHSTDLSVTACYHLRELF